MVLADSQWAEKRGLAPTARLVSYGIAAVEPGMFGLGPVPAVKQALRRAGWDIGSIQRAEINEASRQSPSSSPASSGFPKKSSTLKAARWPMGIRSVRRVPC